MAFPKDKIMVARRIIKRYADKKTIQPEQLFKGYDVEAEHDGRMGKGTDVVKGNKTVRGKIALAHLNEDPFYYDHLEEMEKKYSKKGVEKKGK